MAEIEFDRHGRAESGAQPGSLQGYINIAGAVTSLALIIGVGIWGYKLVRRDAAGVPVIKALQGPMRVAPEDPGGQIARNVGLAVNAVAADEPLPPPANRVVLAPSPVQLAPGDAAPEAMAGSQPAAAPGGAAASGDQGPAQDGAAAGTAPADSSAAPAQSEAPKDPVEAALAAARAATEAVTGEGPQAAVTGGTALAVKSSIRPELRPTGRTVPIDQPAAVPQTVSVDPATLKPGTRLVQLGAYPSVAAAQEAWQKILAQFGPLMDQHGQVIQQAQSGGRVFYRLRAAGFDAESEARAFCAALQAQNAGCIPVTIR